MSASTATYSQEIAGGNPPSLGVTPLPAFITEIFGRPTRNEGKLIIDGYSDQTKYVASLPELVFGQNATNLGTRLVHQNIMAGDFWVKELAPIRELGWNDPLTLQMDMITFHPHLPQVVPQEGRTRIGSWEYTSTTDIVNRKGLGAEFHHEMLFNEKGQFIIRGMMTQIDLGIRTHLNMGVLHAIVHSTDHILERERETNQKTFGSVRLDKFFERTKKFWGVLQRLPDAVYMIESWVDNDQKTNQAPLTDVVLVPFKIPFYITQVNPKYTTFSEIGESARATIEAGPDAFQRWGRHEVKLVSTFDVDRKTGPIDLLLREVVYGEWFLMFDHIPSSYGSYKDYKTAWRNVQILNGDGDADRWDTIKLIEAARNTGLWNEQGEIMDPEDPRLADYRVDLKDKDRRHSFWYRTREGKQKACKYFIQILPENFSVDSALRLARTAIAAGATSLSLYDERIIHTAIEDLQNAIADMSVPSLTQPQLLGWYNMVILQNARNGTGSRKDSASVDWKGDQETASLSLPRVTTPGVDDLRVAAGLPEKAQAAYSFFSGAGLKQIAKEFKTTPGDLFVDLEWVKKIAAAVEIVRKFAISLQGVLGDSIFLNSKFVATSNHRPDAFCAFVDNILAQSRPSVFLRIPTAVERAGQPQGDVFRVAVEAAFATITDTNNKIGKTLQTSFLGPLTTLNAIRNRFAGRRDNAGNVATIAAKLNSASDAVDVNDADAAVFDATAPAGAATVIPVADLFNSLPVFAKGRFNAPDQLTALSAARDHQRYYVYSENLAAGAPAAIKTAYNTIARLFFNYGPNPTVSYVTEASAAAVVSAITDRALILALLNSINIVTTANATNEQAANQIAARVNRLTAEVLNKLAGVAPANLSAMPAELPVQLDRTQLRRLLEQFQAKNQAEFADTFGEYNGKARTAATLSDIFTRLERTGAESAAATKAAILRLGSAVGDVAAVRGAAIAAARATLATREEEAIAAGAAVRVARDAIAAAGADPVARNAAIAIAQEADRVDAAADRARLAARDAVNNAMGDAAARSAAYGNAPRYDLNDYRRTDLRMSPELADILHGARIPLALPADPEDNESCISFARYNELVANIRSPTGRIPGSMAPTIRSGVDQVVLGSTQLHESAAVRTNVRMGKQVFRPPAPNVTYEPAGLQDNEFAKRRSENYGLRAEEIKEYSDDKKHDVPISSGRRFHVDDTVEDMELAPDPRKQYSSMNKVKSLAAASQSDDLHDALANCPSAQKYWDMLNIAALKDAALAAVAKVFLGCSTRFSTWKTFAENNILFPMTILLTRPLAVKETYPLYFLKKGAGTMITRFGQPLTTWSNEGIRQVYNLTVIFKSKTTVISNKGIYHVPNAFIAGLKRGFGIRFFNRESLKQATRGSRIDGADSLVAIAEPYEPYLTAKPASKIALTGKFKFMELHYKDAPKRDDENHYHNIYFANAWWGFQAISRGEKYTERELALDPHNTRCKYDFICHGGKSLHFNPNPSVTSFRYYVPSQGYYEDQHYGPGLITAWRNAWKAYRVHDMSGFDPI
jgi:hypothetical protein